MEELPRRLEGITNTVRRKRTHFFHHRPQSQTVYESSVVSSLSVVMPSDDLRARSSDENIGSGYSSRRKELSLSQCASRFPGANGAENRKPHKFNKKVNEGLDELYGNTGLEDGAKQGLSGSDHKVSCERVIVLALANWKNTSKVKDSIKHQKTMMLYKQTEESPTPPVDGLGSENKVKKVKLKVGGVTRIIGTSSSLRNSHVSNPTISGHEVVHKGNSDGNNWLRNENRGGLQGIPWKDFSKIGFRFGREESSKVKSSKKNGSGKQGGEYSSAQKNNRAPKKRTADGLDDDDSDDEIRYLEKLKRARLSSGFREGDEESSRKCPTLSSSSANSPENVAGTSAAKSGKDEKKRSFEDNDYDEEDYISDSERESGKRKKANKEPVNLLVEPKQELLLTTRQRALQSGKDASTTGGSVVEFPNGLPPASSRKPKEQLTEVEQQLKRAEAAQRRRMQNEKAARESEAEAIRRVLGQGSSRKKKEDKKKKRIDELAREKAADDVMRASSSVRLVMGPNGTTVTFPNNMWLPSIFSGPCSYPPPRETCAGPACTNPYKYRDSKTKLPLCSLQCYNATRGTVLEATTC